VKSESSGAASTTIASLAPRAPSIGSWSAQYEADYGDPKGPVPNPYY
jgi:hypothetical protein